MLQEFKVTGKSQIFMQGRSVDFYNRVKEILLAEYNWCNYYEEFHIVLGKKAGKKWRLAMITNIVAIVITIILLGIAFYIIF